MFIKKIGEKKYFDLNAVLEKITKEKKSFVTKCRQELETMDDNNKFSLGNINVTLRKLRPFEDKIEKLIQVISLCQELDKSDK